MKSKTVRNFLPCPFVIFNTCSSTVEVFAVPSVLHESLEGPCHCPSSPFFLAVNLSEEDFLSGVQCFNWLVTDYIMFFSSLFKSYPVHITWEPAENAGNVIMHFVSLSTRFSCLQLHFGKTNKQTNFIASRSIPLDLL